MSAKGVSFVYYSQILADMVGSLMYYFKICRETYYIGAEGGGGSAGSSFESRLTIFLF